MKKTYLLAPFICAALVAGCATVPPNELVNARFAYQQASEGQAKQLAPAELHTAQEALNLAEQSFKKDSDSQQTKDLAYVAQRKAQKAEALGAIAADKASKERADADFQKKQTAIVKQGKQDLSYSERQTADARAELDKQAAVQAGIDKAEADNRAANARAELDKQAAIQAGKDRANADFQRQQAEIARVKQELNESEMQTAAAKAELAAIAAVREEERGLVVTLSGGVLFRSAEATLMSSSLRKLDQVANALLSVKPRNLIVEGHTDSQGSREYNQGLSQRRADAVRDYLVQKGYPADRIQARGQSEDTPIANNRSPEGRANNRRVEIVIEHESRASNR